MGIHQFQNKFTSIYLSIYRYVYVCVCVLEGKRFFYRMTIHSEGNPVRSQIPNQK